MNLYDYDYINVDGNWIHKTAIVTDAVTMGTGNVIGAYAVIGSNGEMRNTEPDAFQGGVIIGNNNTISEHVTIQRPYEENEFTVIGDNNILMAHSHVGHHVRIYDNCEICTSVVLGGYCRIGYGSKIKLGAIIRNRVTIEREVTIGMGSVVTKDIPALTTAYGNPARW